MNIKMIFDKVFLKFLLVGVINSIVGYTIMLVMHNILHMGYWLSSCSGYFLSAILGFFLNKHFTFRVDRWSAFMVISFIVVIVISYFLPYWIAEQIIIVTFKENSEIFRGNVALVVGTCMASAVSYLCQRFIVFRKKEEDEPAHLNQKNLTTDHANQHEK